MREAIGGTWLFGIVITFIALFTSFLSYSISYTRAFNMKSEILNIIERNEGYTESEGTVENMTEEQLLKDDSAEAKIFYHIKKYGYNYTSASNIDCASVGHPSGTENRTGGYCVTKYCPDAEEVFDEATGTLILKDDGADSKTYYKVTTFIAITIPVINITLKVPVTGETRTLFYDRSSRNSIECVKPTGVYAGVQG